MAISAANKEFVEAFNEGDVRTLAGPYTKDAVMFREGKPNVRGLKAFEAAWKEDIGSGGKSAKVEVVEVQEAGDRAYENGKFWISGADGSTEYAGNSYAQVPTG